LNTEEEPHVQKRKWILWAAFLIFVGGLVVWLRARDEPPQSASAKSGVEPSTDSVALRHSPAAPLALGGPSNSALDAQVPPSLEDKPIKRVREKTPQMKAACEEACASVFRWNLMDEPRSLIFSKQATGFGFHALLESSLGEERPLPSQNVSSGWPRDESSRTLMVKRPILHSNATSKTRTRYSVFPPEINERAGAFLESLCLFASM
jgi:hypothetical protein